MKRIPLLYMSALLIMSLIGFAACGGKETLKKQLTAKEVKKKIDEINDENKKNQEFEDFGKKVQAQAAKNPNQPLDKDDKAMLKKMMATFQKIIDVINIGDGSVQEVQDLKDIKAQFENRIKDLKSAATYGDVLKAVS